MAILRTFLLHIHANPFTYSLISGLIGEEATLFLAFLSGNENLVPLWKVFIFSIIGIVITDSLWFSLGKSKIIQNSKTIKKFAMNNKKIVDSVHRIAGENLFTAFVISKFIYGSRIVTILYSTTKSNFKKFLSYDIPAIIIWASIMLPLGWLAGRGILISFRFLRGLEKGLAFGVLFIIILFLALKLISDKIISKSKNIEADKQIQA